MENNAIGNKMGKPKESKEKMTALSTKGKSMSGICEII